MEVGTVGNEGALTSAHAANRGDDQVEDGHKNHRQREDERQRGHDHLLATEQRRIDLAGDDDAGGGKDEAHGLRSPTHHDRGGVEVEPEEACAHPEQRNHDEAGGRRVGGRAHQTGDDVGVHEERSGADRDHTGGQAVEPVDEVDGIHDADDEENGDEKPQSGGPEREAENREGRQLHASEGHAARDEDLPAELGHPVQLDDVVDDAEDAHGTGAGHDGPRDRGRKERRHVGNS